MGFGGINVKDYPNLIGKIILAAAIKIAAGIIADAIEYAGSTIHSSLTYVAELVRDGLLQ